MSDLGRKADYVRAQTLPPSKWGCWAHWYQLPMELREQILKTYRPGQEIAKDPSDAYIQAAREVEGWIAANGTGEPEMPLFEDRLG